MGKEYKWIPIIILSYNEIMNCLDSVNNLDSVQEFRFCQQFRFCSGI